MKSGVRPAGGAAAARRGAIVRAAAELRRAMRGGKPRIMQAELACSLHSFGGHAHLPHRNQQGWDVGQGYLWCLRARASVSRGTLALYE